MPAKILTDEQLTLVNATFQDRDEAIDKSVRLGMLMAAEHVSVLLDQCVMSKYADKVQCMRAREAYAHAIDAIRAAAESANSPPRP